MNRFLIDEDASNELLGIYQLGKSAYKFEGENYNSLLGAKKEYQDNEIYKKGLNKTYALACCLIQSAIAYILIFFRR